MNSYNVDDNSQYGESIPSDILLWLVKMREIKVSDIKIVLNVNDEGEFETTMYCPILYDIIDHLELMYS